ncbi:hypothetical protein L0337_07805 [candidate division KSB1 bacterium]|nr:hypothetical protein [candidate division KSB1 bacterium]
MQKIARALKIILICNAAVDAQDEIDRQGEQLISDIEGKLQQRVSQTKLFSIRWRLV